MGPPPPAGFGHHRRYGCVDLDHLHHETELDLVRFELELLTSARWLARLTTTELDHYHKLCQQRAGVARPRGRRRIESDVLDPSLIGTRDETRKLADFGTFGPSSTGSCSRSSAMTDSHCRWIAVGPER